MSLQKQITKTTLLISYEQFYIQSHHYQKELILEQIIGEKIPNVPTDLRPLHYVSISNIYWSILQHTTNFSELGAEPTRLLLLMVHTVSLYITFQNTVLHFLKTFKVTFYGFIHLYHEF